MGFFDLPPQLTVALISIGVTLIMTFALKYLTNQKEMKELKEGMKALQKELKASRDDPKKMNEINKKLMEKNMKYMKHSFKPTLYTFLPIILIFSWFNAHIIYDPIAPGHDFTTTLIMQKEAVGNVTLETIPANPDLQENIIVNNASMQTIEDGKVSWLLNAPAEGLYILRYAYESNNKRYIAEREVIITTQQEYKKIAVIPNEKKIPIKMMKVDNQKIKIFGEGFNIFGWFPGSLAYYIIISLIISSVLRKVLKIY